MIAEIDHDLEEWIATVIDSKYKITFEHPGIRDNKPTVSVYLYQMENSIPRSVAREIPLEITLSYLLTVQSESQLDSHKNLGNLLFAAKSRSDLEIGFPSLAADFWQALGIAPLPHFTLRLPLVMARNVGQVPTIKAPPRIDIDSITNIKGFVLGPSNQPIANAKVTLANIKTVAYTDNKGLFSIAADSKALHEFNCKIDAKGKQFSISVPMQKTQNAPITIHLDTLEV